jgi:hypothetical protein
MEAVDKCKAYFVDDVGNCCYSDALQMSAVFVGFIIVLWVTLYQLMFYYVRTIPFLSVG